MRIAVCPGSFDPITNGHLDIIERACGLFDRVIVLVADNADKHCWFSTERRKALIERATAGMPQVTVDVCDGLLADYLKKCGGCAIVKGLRALSDFEYEFQMALANRKLCPEAETVFLTTRTEHMYISSSLVRQIGSFGGDISAFVPPAILADVQAGILETKERQQ